LTMGLGAGAATPMQMATAYSVFANGGYRIAPDLLTKTPAARGEPLSTPPHVEAGKDAERAIDPRNAFIMQSLLREVIATGTATRALSLKRQDIAGKTGTTNDDVDAWFCGFNAAQVGIAWIGFDQPKSLGNRETGSLAALPMWIAYMEKAAKGGAQAQRDPPPRRGSLR